MLFVCVRCKPGHRYDSIIKNELSFGCSKETMVSFKLMMISWNPG